MKFVENVITQMSLDELIQIEETNQNEPKSEYFKI